MGSITNWFYGGKDRAFFTRHGDEIRQANTRTAGTFSIVISAIVVLYTMLVCITRLETDYTVLFITSGILIVLNVYYWVWGRNHPKQTVYYLQVLLICLVTFLIYRDSTDVNVYAVFIPLFMVVLPLLFINPMHKTLVSSIVVLVVYTICSFVFKGLSGFAVYDVIDGLIAASF